MEYLILITNQDNKTSEHHAAIAMDGDFNLSAADVAYELGVIQRMVEKGLKDYMIAHCADDLTVEKMETIHFKEVYNEMLSTSKKTHFRFTF